MRDQPRIELVVAELAVAVDQVGEQFARSAGLLDLCAVAARGRVQIVVARIAGEDRADADAPRRAPCGHDRTTSVTDFILISIFFSATLSANSGAWIRKALAAELVGHLRRDVVDVGIVLALDAAGRRHDLDVEACAPGSASRRRR